MNDIFGSPEGTAIVALVILITYILLFLAILKIPKILIALNNLVKLNALRARKEGIELNAVIDCLRDNADLNKDNIFIEQLKATAK